MTMRLNEGGKNRVMNERGITTKVKNDSDGKMYWIGTTRRADGTWITVVAQGRMFGMLPKSGERALEITTATSEKEAMEIHFAVEEIGQDRAVSQIGSVAQVIGRRPEALPDEAGGREAEARGRVSELRSCLLPKEREAAT